MVIIFQNEKARTRLLEEGFVITFRKNKRKGVVLTDWMTDKRGGKKIVDVKVWTMHEHKQHQDFADFWNMLIGLHKWSGFDTSSEWLKAIKELNKEKTPHLGYFYLVVVRD